MPSVPAKLHATQAKIHQRKTHIPPTIAVKMAPDGYRRRATSPSPEPLDRIRLRVGVLAEVLRKPIQRRTTRSITSYPGTAHPTREAAS